MTRDVFDTRGDHRLVMAGLLLSMLAGDVTLTDPWCVTKSYPGFWDHARAAGWSVGM
jgi:3-phosphoshikimate 1-carboxyvinyltransferase